jgi:hypothetical protein
MNRECALCGWVNPDGTPHPGWCQRCRGRTVADVADLPELYHTLAATLTPGAGNTEPRVGGSRTPPLPLRLDAANLRGPATAGPLPGGDNGGALSIATVLSTVRVLVRGACDLPDEWHQGNADTDNAVERDSKFLIAWLDRYAERVDPEELASVAQALHDTRQRAWNACGYGAHKIYLGPCPHTEDGQVCGRELWIDPVLADSVTCRDCHTRWDRRYFLWLRRQAEEAG